MNCNSMTQKTWLIVFLFIIFDTLFLWGVAQNCTYNFQNLFVLNVVDENDNPFTKKCTIYLADSKKNQLFTNILDESEPEAVYIAQPVQFQKNSDTPKKSKAQFPKLENYYWAPINTSAYPNNCLPFYFAMVVFDNDTTFIYLPVETSLNICENKLNKEWDSKDKILATEDGSPFEPFKIIIDRVKDSVYTTYSYPPYIFKYHLNNPMNNYHNDDFSNSGRVLDNFEVIETKTFKTIQHLPIKSDYSFTAGTHKKTIQLVDLFGDNPPHIFDLKILTKIDEPTKAGEIRESYYDFYLFDSITQKYKFNRDLSEPANVFIDSNHIPRFTKIIDSSPYKITQNYMFKNNRWVIVTIDSLLNHPPQINYSPIMNKCVERVDADLKLLSVLIIGDTLNHTISIFDSLQFINNCRERLTLTAASVNAPSFSIPASVTPLKRFSVYFNKQESVHEDQIKQFEYGCYFNTSGEQLVTVTLRYFVAGHKTILRDPQNNRITSFRNHSENNFTAYTVEVNAQRLPTGYGEVAILTGEKVGTWLYYDHDNHSRFGKEYSKKYSIVINNPDSSVSNAQPEIYVSGNWIVPNFIKTFNGFSMYCPENTDSIRVQTHSGIASCIYNYATSTNDTGIDLFILKPGEPYLIQGIRRVPIQFSKQEYVIFWDESQFELNNKEEAILAVIEKMKHKFPNILIQNYQGLKQVFNIDLSQYPENERDKILHQLNKMEQIDFLSRIVYLGRGVESFTNNRITINFKNPEIGEEIYAQLKKLGFTEVDAQRPARNLKYFKYSSDIVDIEFYTKINEISSLPGVEKVDPNFYFNHHIDTVPKK